MKECCAEYLNQQFGGDDAIVNEIYREYVDSIREKLKEADVALVGGEWLPLDRVAHTIKGNALATGDGEMAQVAIELRSAAQLQDRERAATLVTQIQVLAEKL